MMYYRSEHETHICVSCYSHEYLNLCQISIMILNTTHYLNDIQRSHCQNFIILENLSTWLSLISGPNYSKYPISHNKYLYTITLSTPENYSLSQKRLKLCKINNSKYKWTLTLLNDLIIYETLLKFNHIEWIWKLHFKLPVMLKPKNLSFDI